MDVFAKQLLDTGYVPFWMDIKTLHCLYLASKFSNYVVCYNQCFNSDMDSRLEIGIEDTKKLLFSGQSPHAPPFWVPSFCSLFPSIIKKCLCVIETGPPSAWIPEELLGQELSEELKSTLINNAGERNISSRFHSFCTECKRDPLRIELAEASEEKDQKDLCLTDASSLDNIDALATSLRSVEDVKKTETIRRNFAMRIRTLRLDEVSMWMLFYWIVHMPDEEYDTFMSFVCGGIPILTERQIHAMEVWRRENIKETKLEGIIDNRVLSFMMIFYKV